jgi:hypothetical protein
MYPATLKQLSQGTDVAQMVFTLIACSNNCNNIFLLIDQKV